MNNSEAHQQRVLTETITSTLDLLHNQPPHAHNHMNTRYYIIMLHIYVHDSEFAYDF